MWITRSVRCVGESHKPLLKLLFDVPAALIGQVSNKHPMIHNTVGLGRLTFGEIRRDIDKLSAHRQEVVARGHDFLPVMLVLDTAPEDDELMKDSAIEKCKRYAKESGIPFMYCAPTTDYVDI